MKYWHAKLLTFSLEILASVVVLNQQEWKIEESQSQAEIQTYDRDECPLYNKIS